MDIGKYKTLIFDCDGVILDSNRAKTEAFREVARPFGDAAADALVKYHQDNGGISRYVKFQHFLERILPIHGEGADHPDVEALLDAYAKICRTGLMRCAVAPGLERMREVTKNCRWAVVSGGDQDELRETFAARELDGLFDLGIFGSPDTKEEILQREIDGGAIAFPALFLGDSRADHVASRSVGIDFVFVYQWTEFGDWKRYCRKNGLGAIRRVDNLLSADS